jgi:uncharacterized protein
MSESTIDQQFIEYVVKSLVSKPEAVKLDRIIDEKGVLLTLTVDPEDLGRVIGKRGATAQSLRTLLRALGTKNEARYNLKIVDNGIPREERMSSQTAPESGPTSDWSSAPTGANDNSGLPMSSSDDDDSFSSSSSAATDAADASGEEESAVSRTRKELEDLDDLDI